jgi:GTP-binding protein
VPAVAPLRLRFLRSASDVDELPPTRAEVAVVGRSNVGKSSLLNALSGGRAVAHVSKTPGRTQLLNAFALGEDPADGPAPRTMLDCPGYGYAATSKAVRASWGPMIERYLLERPHLEMVMVLVDGEVGPTKLDLQMLDWLRAHEVPHSVVATKHDKVKASRRQRRRAELAGACQLEPGDVTWVSAARNVNVELLRDLVRRWLDVSPG